MKYSAIILAGLCLAGCLGPVYPSISETQAKAAFTALGITAQYGWSQNYPCYGGTRRGIAFAGLTSTGVRIKGWMCGSSTSTEAVNIDLDPQSKELVWTKP